MQPSEEDVFGPVIVEIRTENGDRVSVIERVDGSRFEVRVPRGAMTGWECYRPGIGPWIRDLAGSEAGQESSDPAARDRCPTCGSVLSGHALAAGVCFECGSLVPDRHALSIA